MKKIFKIYLPALVIGLLFIGFIATTATSAPKEPGISLIRDEETEKFLKEITSPIFRSIGLDEDSVEIIIINDPAINAFVAGGQKVFINTGLIMESDEASSLVGVIAHEAGHIKGAHLVQKSASFENANIGMLAGYVLGLGSVIAGAPAEAGLAISAASQNIATRNALSYSRDYENAADAVALDVLKEIGVTPRGLIRILRKLVMKQKISGDIVDKYLLTHPVSEDRINFLENAIKSDPGIDKKTPQSTEDRFKKVKAKFYGYLADPRKTRSIYSGKSSDDALYALSIAYNKEARFSEADQLLKELMNRNPGDPYLYELAAQYQFERGHIAEAVLQYEKVSGMLPNSNLVKLNLANAMLAMEDANYYKKAIGVLKNIILREPRNIAAINRLGLAYGKLGQLGKSYLYLAEASIIAKDKENSKFYLAKAEQNVDKSSQDYLKFNELKKELGRLLED